MGPWSAKEVCIGTGLKCGVVASCVLGIGQHSLDTSRGFMDSIFMAFTTESNIWVAGVCFVFLGIDLVTKGKRGVAPMLVRDQVHVHHIRSADTDGVRGAAHANNEHRLLGVPIQHPAA